MRLVHPRVRGEHKELLTVNTTDSGSSPRARGTQLHFVRAAPLPRFIPACAGNTLPWWRSFGTASVHPRVRGEHYNTFTCTCRNTGSSPRARGTPHQEPCALDCDRFIPACAGNTSLTRAQIALSSVHPRVRGEHSFRKPLIGILFRHVKELTRF